MRRTLLYVWMLVGVLLGGALPVYAQGSNPGQVGAPFRYQTGTLSALGSVSVSTQGLASVGMQITISASATVSFEGKTDDASSTFTALNCTPPNSTTAVTSTTASGLWTCNVGGLRTVQARVSTYGSGTIRVAIAAALSTARGGGGSGSGAPTDATYIVQIPNATLTNEQALSLLPTGILKSTTATGVVSIATSADTIAQWSGSCSASTVLGGGGACTSIATGFDVITSGTNTAAAMVVSTGASLTTGGTGTITANRLAATAAITITSTTNPQISVVNGANTSTINFAFGNATFGAGVRALSFDPGNGIYQGGSAVGAPDVGLSRVAAGVWSVNDGASSSTFKEIKYRSAIVGGTIPGISGCSAGTQLGGGTAGSFASGTTGACAVTLTFAFTAPTGWACSAANGTTPANLYQQNGGSATTATFTGTTVSGDVIRFHCVAY